MAKTGMCSLTTPYLEHVQVLSQTRTTFSKWKKNKRHPPRPPLVTVWEINDLHSKDTTFYLMMLLFCCRFQLLEFSCKLFL